MPRNVPHIFRLSEDIILSILSLCGPSAFADKLVTAQSVQDKRWIKDYSHALTITHTCRLWREYALRTPSLWSIPLLDRPKLCQMMLERAGNVPLTVRWPPYVNNIGCDEDGNTIRGEVPEASDDPVDLQVDEILENTPSVHELALSAGSAGIAEMLDSISESLILNTLRIGPTEHVIQDDIWRMPENTIPPFLSLSRLICYSCLPPTNYLGMNSITALTIDCSSIGPRSCPHVASFGETLDILRSTLALTRLTLECLVDTQSLPSSPVPPVELRDLQQLCISDGPDVVLALASHIRSPHQVETTLSMCLNYDQHVSEWRTHCTQEETVPFLAAVRDLMRTKHIRQPPISRAIFDVDYRAFNYRLSLDKRAGLQAEASPFQAFSIQFNHVSYSPTAALDWGSATLDLGEIVDLVLDIQPAWNFRDAEPANAAELAAALRRMPCLQYVTLRKSPTLVKVLATAISLTRNDSAPCPSLNVLRILYSDVWQDSDPTVFEEVCCGLRGREAAGRQKLTRIVIDERTSIQPLTKTVQSDRTRMLAKYATHVEVPSAAPDST
jgi:hypothetical protein